jgi:superoxide dismutase, Fe-Mn family
MKKIFAYFLMVMVFPLASIAQQESIHKFAALPYAYDALEPYIDKMTMEIHYDRHHRAYYKNFMTAIQSSELEKTQMEAIFANISSQTVVIRNNGGGYWNHEFFWNCMKPNGGGEPSGKLAKAINESFGSFEDFKKQFADAGAKRFGSGWAWLVAGSDGKLFITSTANQDNPLMNTEEKRGMPILALDVWEHAYYLKYQNKRGDYISSFWSVVNWEFAEDQYNKAIKKK